MDSSSSLSQGCFAYKRKIPKATSKSPSKKRRHPNETNSAASSLLQRLEIFKDVWKDIYKKLQAVWDESSTPESLNTEMTPSWNHLMLFKSGLEIPTALANIATLIINAFLHANQARIFIDVLEELKSFLSSYSERVPESEIPTALFVTGANVSDHEAVFETLRNEITTSLSPHVVSLRSKDCPNIKSVVRKFANDLIGGSLNEDCGLFKDKVTMSKLSAWYQHQYAKMTRASPRKQRKMENVFLDKSSNRSIYIILENFESFNTDVIENFVLLISEYSAKMPVVFVFGVFTPSVVHQVLSQASSSQLSMRTFQFPGPDVCLDHVITKLLQMGSVFPLKLGNRLFQLLEDNFLLDTLSSQAFMTGVKVCYMEHYYSKTWSTLCDRLTEMPRHADTLDHTSLEDIRRLPSFRGYVQNREPKEQRQLLLDDDHLRKTVKRLVTEIVNYGNNFHPILSLLRTLTLNLPKSPFGERLRELYSLCLRCEVVDTEQFNDVLQSLRLMDREGLLTKLTLARKVMRASCEVLPAETKLIDNTLLGFVERLTKMGEENETEIKKCPPKPALKLAPVMDRQKLIQALKEHSKIIKLKSNFQTSREEIVNFVDSTVRWYLRNYRRLPLHEILYCDSYDDVKRQLMGNARGSVLTALSNPHHYLKCQCCELTDVDQILPSLPNISIMYKLHLECGRMINLYDWLQAYFLILEASKRGGKNQDEESRQRSVTTFAQAVSELQHLGFLKPTQRKTDHVARLTW